MRVVYACAHRANIYAHESLNIQRDWVADCARVRTYIQVVHTYRSRYRLFYPCGTFPWTPSDAPLGVATPRIERDIDVTSQLSPSMPALLPLLVNRNPPLPTFSTQKTTPRYVIFRHRTGPDIFRYRSLRSCARKNYAGMRNIEKKLMKLNQMMNNLLI